MHLQQEERSISDLAELAHRIYFYAVKQEFDLRRNISFEEAAGFYTTTNQVVSSRVLGLLFAGNNLQFHVVWERYLNLYIHCCNQYGAPPEDATISAQEIIESVIRESNSGGSFKEIFITKFIINLKTKEPSKESSHAFFGTKFAEISSGESTPHKASNKASNVCTIT